LSGRDAVSIRDVQAFVLAALSYDLEPGPILAAAGLRFEDLGNADLRISHARLVRLVGEALRGAGDPDFGLHMAELTLQAPLPSVLGQALFASATIGEGLRRLLRFLHLYHGEAMLWLEEDGDGVRLCHTPDPGTPEVTRALSERAFAAVFLSARRQAGAGFTLREVTFAHAAPPSVTEHARFGADPELVAVLDAHLVSLPSAPPDRFLQLVRSRIADALPNGTPSAELVAARVGMGARTFRRRIAECQTTYLDLVAAVRQELARTLLADPELAISEVAFALGYAEVSAFHRAFRGWTGTTPAAFRRERAAG
jgi:AraC-like DNA-binding protein